MTIAMKDAGLQSILQRASRGCPEAFSELYGSHYRYVLWVCRRYFWRPEDVEDAAAEVFLKLHSVLGSHDPAQPFRPWLAQVTSRHCLDRLRRQDRERRRHAGEEEIAALPDVATASPLAQVLHKEKMQQISSELDRLPERLRVPLVLHYQKEMSYEEIARALGSRMPNVKAILFRARRALRRKLQRPKCTAKDSRPVAKRTSQRLFSSVISQACAAD